MTEIVSFLTGTVWKMLVKVGDAVEKGQEVAIVESMKMEIPITAATSGVVTEILVNEGDLVKEGDLIMRLEG
jgi:acetyl-CoA carboxylase biotin carboxyl carrier protein